MKLAITTTDPSVRPCLVKYVRNQNDNDASLFSQYRAARVLRGEGIEVDFGDRVSREELTAGLGQLHRHCMLAAGSTRVAVEIV